MAPCSSLTKAVITASALLTSANAFSVVGPCARRTQLTPLAMSDFGTAMPEKLPVFEQLGIEEDNLALGVDADEVLKYIGT